MKLLILFSVIALVATDDTSSSDDIMPYIDFVTAKIDEFFKNFDANLDITLRGQDNR